MGHKETSLDFKGIVAHFGKYALTQLNERTDASCIIAAAEGLVL